MTEIATIDMTADEARDSVRLAKGGLEAAAEQVVRQINGRAWIALGYESWDAMREAEYSGAAVIVPRLDRPQLSARLAAEGLSQRQISETLGVSQQTVSNDLADVTKTGNAPIPETRTDSLGREQPRAKPRPVHSPPPKPEIPDADLAEFPELEHFADRPAKAAALATQLRSFEPAEREQRRETLGKVIAAEKDGRLAPQPDPAADAIGLADRLFVAANEAAQVAEKVGGVTAIEAAVAVADPAQIELWREQFTDLAATLVRLAGACRPQLRRVQ